MYIYLFAVDERADPFNETRDESGKSEEEKRQDAGKEEPSGIYLKLTIAAVDSQAVSTTAAVAVAYSLLLLLESYRSFLVMVMLCGTDLGSRGRVGDE